MTNTMIQIDKKTAKRIKQRAVSKRDSYDEIINRVFDDQEKRSV